MVDQHEGPDESGEGSRLDDVGGFSVDELHRALAEERRRRVLSLLLSEGDRTQDELATLLAGWEATETGTMRSSDDRDRIATLLHHATLPMLDAMDLLSYDPTDGTVRLSSLDEAVREALERATPSADT